MRDGGAGVPPYPVEAVANWFIEMSFLDGKDLTQMHLQKLVYIAHGWHMALRGAPLVREKAQAWKYGPVYRGLFEQTKGYGSLPIHEYLWDAEGSVPIVPEGDAETTELLKTVWSSYRDFSAIQLSAMTHRKGTPWYTTWWDHGGKETPYRDLEIDDRLIKRHFEELVSKGAGAA